MWMTLSPPPRNLAGNLALALPTSGEDADSSRERGRRLTATPRVQSPVASVTCRSVSASGYARS